MHLPPDENYTTMKPEWVEWDSELPYNKVCIVQAYTLLL